MSPSATPGPGSLPALSLIAVPGRRAATVELAADIERRGFAGIWCPSYGDCMALSQAVLAATSTIKVATSIQPIYLRHPSDLAGHAAFLHEMSGGRFLLGLGVSHGPVHERLGASVGRPLADARAYVEAVRACEPGSGALPPVVLATLRDKMLDLACEIGGGAVWANASLSAMGAQAARARAARPDGFVLANMVPTVIGDDRVAARAVHRRTLTGYVRLPNYRNYWRAAGFAAEMDAIEGALGEGRKDLDALMPDHWLDDVTLSGTADEVRAGVDRWFATGVLPILVPSATSGGQLQAFRDVFAAYA